MQFYDIDINIDFYLSQETEMETPILLFFALKTVKICPIKVNI